MKNEKHQQAKNLFFQTNLTKTEIANALDVNRRTIYLWAREGDWERLRLSARHMPSMVAEQCYYTLSHLTQNILAEGREGIPVTYKEAETMHKVALTINKLKNRNTVNESMEMFTFFLDRLKKKDPELTEKIKPHIEEHISACKDVYINDFLLDGLNDYGYIPLKDKDKEYAEQKLDEQNNLELEQKRDSVPLQRDRGGIFLRYFFTSND